MLRQAVPDLTGRQAAVQRARAEAAKPAGLQAGGGVVWRTRSGGTPGTRAVALAPTAAAKKRAGQHVERGDRSPTPLKKAKSLSTFVLIRLSTCSGC